ncbi:hypothetical protein [Mastigocoleus testarum]|uniref:Uncharacterized protein n=1 Tax=Mastigocoleus testarum BC008 TaxID=371196 RepID=A0A0V7ZTU6_9CYAN|nr:hypothetical protein [Mastigocoleus testarum]KST67567.1 hypothetical protein BC008_30695 [Mastigocoleus testarum BC008]KST69797.1 hypothetical protein BC008_36155 [Mastigocoleus testarum BC008]
MRTKKEKNSWLPILITANGVLSFVIQPNAVSANETSLYIGNQIQVCTNPNIALSQFRLQKTYTCNQYQPDIVNRENYVLDRQRYSRKILPKEKKNPKKILPKSIKFLAHSAGPIDQFNLKSQLKNASILDAVTEEIDLEQKIKNTKFSLICDRINTEIEKKSDSESQFGKLESINALQFCQNPVNRFIREDSQPNKNNQIIVSYSPTSFPYLLSQTTESPPQTPTESAVQNEESPNPTPENSQILDPPPVEGEAANIDSNPSPAQVEKNLSTKKSKRTKKIERLLKVLKLNQQQQSVSSSSDKDVKNGVNTDDNSDTELGVVRVLERPLEQLPIPEEPVAKFKPVGYLLARFGYFQTSNIFSAEVDPQSDGLFYSGLTLSSIPFRIGGQTYLRGSIDGNIFRYMDQVDFNYNQLRFNLGIFQRLNPKMYAEIGWRNQQLFYARDSDRYNIGSGEKFLNENAFRLSLGRRDPLSKKLMLDSFYELRVSLTDIPRKRNRVINYLSIFLNYYLQKPLQVGLGYQFNYSDFTERIREDNYHRFLASLNYKMSDYSNLSLQTGISLGSSTQDNIDFDGWFFSINYNLDLGRF